MSNCLFSFSGREFSRNTSAADGGRERKEKGIGASPTIHTAFRGIKLLLIRDCRVRDRYTATTIMVWSWYKFHGLSSRSKVRSKNLDGSIAKCQIVESTIIQNACGIAFEAILVPRLSPSFLFNRIASVGELGEGLGTRVLWSLKKLCWNGLSTHQPVRRCLW